MSTILPSPWEASGHRKLVRRAEDAFDPSAVAKAVRRLRALARQHGVEHAVEGRPPALEEEIGSAFFAKYIAGYNLGLRQKARHRGTIYGVRKIAGALSVTERFG